VRYVLFDLLYLAGEPLLHEPLEQRRARLAEVCGPLGCAGVLFSAGVVGRGLELYAQALGSGHEGVMAKRRTACYRPGRRSAAWLKIKPGCRFSPGDDVGDGVSGTAVGRAQQC
jgi:ATP-dependent DNA ligase